MNNKKTLKEKEMRKRVYVSQFYYIKCHFLL